MLKAKFQIRMWLSGVLCCSLILITMPVVAGKYLDQFMPDVVTDEVEQRQLMERLITKLERKLALFDQAIKQVESTDNELFVEATRQSGRLTQASIVIMDGFGGVRGLHGIEKGLQRMDRVVFEVDEFLFAQVVPIAIERRWVDVGLIADEIRFLRPTVRDSRSRQPVAELEQISIMTDAVVDLKRAILRHFRSASDADKELRAAFAQASKRAEYLQSAAASRRPTQNQRLIANNLLSAWASVDAAIENSLTPPQLVERWSAVKQLIFSVTSVQS